jgi:hypothetical protein
MCALSHAARARNHRPVLCAHAQPPPEHATTQTINCAHAHTRPQDAEKRTKEVERREAEAEKRAAAVAARERAAEDRDAELKAGRLSGMAGVRAAVRWFRQRARWALVCTANTLLTLLAQLLASPYPIPPLALPHPLPHPMSHPISVLSPLTSLPRLI